MLEAWEEQEEYLVGFLEGLGLEDTLLVLKL